MRSFLYGKTHKERITCPACEKLVELSHAYKGYECESGQFFHGNQKEPDKDCYNIWIKQNDIKKECL